MSHEEKALSYFKDKFQCSQAVLAAYAYELELTEEQTLKVAFCFNSGMRKGEVCGACSGALTVCKDMVALAVHILEEIIE